MAEVIGKIREFLEESELNFDYDEESMCFHFGLTVDNGSVRVSIIGSDEDDFMVIYVMWNGSVPVRSLPSVYPIINDINSSTRYTTLSVDPKDGEISCRVGMNTDESVLSLRQVGVGLSMAVRTLDENIERIMRAAWSAPSNADGRLN